MLFRSAGDAVAVGAAAGDAADRDAAAGDVAAGDAIRNAAAGVFFGNAGNSNAGNGTVY